MPALAGAASLQEKFSDELDYPPRTFSCRPFKRGIDRDPSIMVKFVCPMSHKKIIPKKKEDASQDVSFFYNDVSHSGAYARFLLGH